MPRYIFKMPLQAEPMEMELRDDKEAWSQAVTALGEMLRDCDGHLPPDTQWGVWVTETGRDVAVIEVKARRFEG